MMETGSGETARTASLLKEKLLQRAPEHGKYPMDIEGLVITRRHEANINRFSRKMPLNCGTFA